MALLTLLLLATVGWHLKDLQDNVAEQVRKRIDRALAKAKESAMTTAS